MEFRLSIVSPIPLGNTASDHCHHYPREREWAALEGCARTGGWWALAFSTESCDFHLVLFSYFDKPFHIILGWFQVLHCQSWPTDELTEALASGCRLAQGIHICLFSSLCFCFPSFHFLNRKKQNVEEMNKSKTLSPTTPLSSTLLLPCLHGRNGGCTSPDMGRASI